MNESGCLLNGEGSMTNVERLEQGSTPSNGVAPRCAGAAQTAGQHEPADLLAPILGRVWPPWSDPCSLLQAIGLPGSPTRRRF